MDLRNLVFFYTFVLITFIKDVLSQQNEDENICLKYPGNLIIANPSDCFSFYACQYGNAMKIICPNNSIFNPKLGNCDPDFKDCEIDEKPVTLNDTTDKKELLSEDMNEAGEVDTNNSENESNMESATTDDSNSTISTSLSSSTTNVPTDTTTTSIISTTSPEDCESCSKPIPPNPSCPSNDTEDPSFLANDLFCDSFYLCYHGRPYEMFCPVGFSWSQEHEKCILERESNCTDSSGKRVPKCPSKGQFFIPHTERCNLFYYCENGIRSIQQCTAFKQWDVVEQTCKLDISAKCIKTIPRSQRAQYFEL